MIPCPSYSPITIFDIRFSGIDFPQSNQQQIQRLMKKYALAEVDVKLIIAADEDHIDAFGRLA